MNEVMSATYFIKLIIASGLFWVLFVLLLQHQKSFRYNRFFLLSGMLFPLVCPLLRLPLNVQEATALQLTLEEITIGVGGGRAEGLVRLLEFWPWGIGLVSILFLARFSYSLLSLFRAIMGKHPVVFQGMKVITVPAQAGTHSFFHYLFVPEGMEAKALPSSIMAHEQTHFQQLHSLDILVSEIISSLFWFNPFFWLIRKKMKTNHEFLADHSVAETEEKKRELQNEMLVQFIGVPASSLVHSFGGSLIFNRIKMLNMKKNEKSLKINLLISGCMAIAIMGMTSLATTESASATNLSTPLGTTEAILSSFLSDLPGPVGNGSLLSALPPSGSNQSMGKAWEGFDDPPKGKKTKATTTSPKDQVFLVIEEPAEFPGGQEALIRYMVEHIKYPEEARKAGIQGKVFVEFEVDKEGNVGKVKVIRGVNKDLDGEAARVIKGMPKWKPAMEKKKPVASILTLPVNFKLDTKEKPKP
jgi:TonB family protein